MIGCPGIGAGKPEDIGHLHGLACFLREQYYGVLGVQRGGYYYFTNGYLQR